LRGKKSGQRWLCVILSQLLPEKAQIFENFLHPDLIWDEENNLKIELDVWVPKYNLALEYQGEYHYSDLHKAYGLSGTVASNAERDMKKQQLCAKNGITLIIIPFWWNESQDSLAYTLHSQCPELFPKIDSSPIPVNYQTRLGRVIQE